MEAIRSVLTGSALIRFARERWRPLVFTAWAAAVLAAYLSQFSDSLDRIGDVLSRIFGGA